jgi:hypothetical protein
MIIPFIHQTCRAGAAERAEALESPPPHSRWASVVMIVVGGAAYGFALGVARAPVMGLYVAVKLPLLIFLTLTINGLLNGILAQVLGSGLSFRQTWAALLQSFAMFALIVGSLASVAAYFTMNADFQEDRGKAYAIMLLLHVVIMATAGIFANFRLLAALQLLLPHGNIARQVLLAWLLGNLFVGAQFSYLLRPFFGQPGLEIQFLRPDAFTGNFYDTVWKMSRHLIGTGGVIGVLSVGLIIFALCMKKQSPHP